MWRKTNTGWLPAKSPRRRHLPVATRSRAAPTGTAKPGRRAAKIGAAYKGAKEVLLLRRLEVVSRFAVRVIIKTFALFIFGNAQADHHIDQQTITETIADQTMAVPTPHNWAINWALISYSPTALAT